MNIQEIIQFFGNFKKFPNMQFPLDAEGLDSAQINNALTMAIGNIGGNRYYLAAPTAQTKWSGFAFLATQKYPLGELLYIDGAGVSNAMMQSHLCVIEQPVNVSAGGYNYDGAYTSRKLVHGVAGNGVEWFAKSEFKQLKTNAELAAEVGQLTEKVDNFSPEAVGSIKIWASQNIPEDWLICAGQSLITTEYTGLFDILGYQYGGAGNSFNLPDLRGNVPVGYRQGDTDFGTLGQMGGEKAHKLTPGEQGGFSFQVWADDGDSQSNPGYLKSILSLKIQDQFLDVGNFGPGQASPVKQVALDEAANQHNNLQPYITLNYIIRAK